MSRVYTLLLKMHVRNFIYFINIDVINILRNIYCMLKLKRTDILFNFSLLYFVVRRITKFFDSLFHRNG